jgi:pimeloyl-ACP methyl ester carboxylesterase
LLHDHLKIDEFNLVGHDWGGPTAFALTCAHQEAVRKLAILDVAIPGDGADFSQNGRRWHHAFFRTAHLPEALLHGREDIYINWLFENYSYLPNSISEEDRKEYLRTYSKPGAMTALFEYYRALPQDAKDNQEFIATNGKLKMPVLALGGDKSFGRGIETLESMQRSLGYRGTTRICSKSTSRFFPRHPSLIFNHHEGDKHDSKSQKSYDRYLGYRSGIVVSLLSTRPNTI